MDTSLVVVTLTAFTIGACAFLAGFLTVNLAPKEPSGRLLLVAGALAMVSGVASAFGSWLSVRADGGLLATLIFLSVAMALVTLAARGAVRGVRWDEAHFGAAPAPRHRELPVELTKPMVRG